MCVWNDGGGDGRAVAVPGWGMGEPRDVMVFFATDDALELGGILGLVEST